LLFEVGENGDRASSAQAEVGDEPTARAASV
jgi:hypothetical protein